MKNQNLKILIIRFRQLGDTVLTTPLLNTLRDTFPDATIDMVLNEHIAPLFADHPALNHIHTFGKTEHHHMLQYIPKVWHIVHKHHYDVIIDVFTTFYSQLFALFSPSTPYRIAVKKSYSKVFSNYHRPSCGTGSMVEHNIDMALPLECITPLKRNNLINMTILPEEIESMKNYLSDMGLDLNKKIILMGVTAKLADKVWHEDRMTWVIDKFTAENPDAQIIFNYAPGQEETNARRIYTNLKDNRNVFIDVKTNSPRQLFALSHLIDLYFGNEGGARHIVHAAGKPSFVVCAPTSVKSTWIPKDNIPADGISAAEIADTTTLNAAEMYDCITREAVWEQLCRFIHKNQIIL